MVTYGQANGFFVGLLMKEAARRVIDVAQARRFTHEVNEKIGPDGSKSLVTNVDERAQEIYVRMLNKGFSEHGILAEEQEFVRACTHPTEQLWWSLDGIDGTTRFTMGQSHGIGTMSALMHNGEVIAACVGDINTGELYVFRPPNSEGSKVRVYRIMPSGVARQLTYDTTRPIGKQMVLLREEPDFFSPGAQKITAAKLQNGLFSRRGQTGGSIGISFARLWKGEAGALLLKPTMVYPWDEWPLIGISKAMGFAFYAVDPKSGVLTPANMRPQREAWNRDYETLVIHQSLQRYFTVA